jgi:predicted ArsR family transcriptional regulator
MNFDNEIKNQLQNYLVTAGVISNQTVWHNQTGGRTNKVWRLDR